MLPISVGIFGLGFIVYIFWFYCWESKFLKTLPCFSSYYSSVCVCLLTICLLTIQAVYVQAINSLEWHPGLQYAFIYQVSSSHSLENIKAVVLSRSYFITFDSIFLSRYIFCKTGESTKAKSPTKLKMTIVFLTTFFINVLKIFEPSIRWVVTCYLRNLMFLCDTDDKMMR